MNAPLTRRRGQSVNDYLRDRAIRHAIYFQRLTLGEIQQIVGLLNSQVLPDLMGRIEQALEDGARRLAVLRDATRDVLHAGFGELKRRLVDDLVAIAGAEADWQAQTFGRAVPHLDVDYVTPSPAMLRAIVTSKPFEGELLGTWWNGIEADTQAKVLEQLKIGLAEGDTIDDLVRRIRGRREEGYQDGVMQGTRRNIASVVRTATNHVSNDARMATYQENTDVVKGWQFVATLDDRTTIICAANDGKVFPVDDTEHAPPLHWGCRSTTVPVLKSFEELGIKGLDELPDGERAAMDGQVPAAETFEEWLRKQPASVQDEVLGSSRAEIFRRGELSLDRFVDDKNRVLTLDELRALEAEGGGDSGGGEPPAPGAAPAPTNPSGEDTRARLDAVLEAVQAQQLELGRKIEALDRELQAATSAAAQTQLMRRIGRLGSARAALLANQRRIAHRILRVADPAPVVVRGATKPTKEAVPFLSSILSRQAAPDGLTVQQVTERARSRAYYSYDDHSIHIARRGQVRSSVHEMGHALEDRYPRQFAERVRDFLWRRAQADRRGLRRLGDIYRQPGWNPGEIAWEDEFLEPYMGKFYPVTGTTIDQFREIALSLGPVKRAQIGATEITSMGVELLWTDPLRLLREDPEFFEFIVNLLRGR